MNEKICYICNNIALFKFKKGNTDYHQCINCRTIFSGPLDQEGLVGGGAEIERNTQQNHLRIQRVAELSLGEKKEDLFILDAGAGHGLFIKDLKEAGYPNVDGWDAYNPEYSRLPEKDKYHIITCVEMIEHTSANYVEIDVMYRALKKGGVVYFETGFLNATWDEGIPDEENPYINPNAGHSTIWTHHGMDLLMVLKGFMLLQKINRHCHVYIKK